MINKTKLLAATILALPLISKAQDVKVDFVTDRIARVQWASDGNTASNNTGACVYKPQNVKVETKVSDSQIIMSTPELQVIISRQTQAVAFADPKTGKIILSENPARPRSCEPVVQERVVYDEKSARSETTANGSVTVKDVIRRDTIGRSTRYVANFMHGSEKAIYGLGSQMEDYMNLMGKTLFLTQHNLKTHVPMINTNGGYGLMFDAGCAMKFVSDTLAHEFSMQMEAAREIDYYFIKGSSMSEVAAGYRLLTGKVSLMPKYVFGYTQSKERYCSQQEIVDVLKEYRRRQIPIDMIVQDWNYWPQGWGYMKMDPKYYPDPKALADSVHALGARLMISIWPNPQWCPEADDFKQRGMMLEHDVYDVFSPEARRHYWSYANREFFSKGFDAWWCDSSEPLDGDWNRPPEPENGTPYGWDSHERRWNLNKDVLSDALGAERSSLYSLYHSMGIYENQRAAGSQKRVVNLTRSSFLGQQRYGTIVWNGDTHASWESFRQQIPSGLNYMATGNPYWTVDVGSFFTKSGGRWFYKGQFPDGVNDDEYKEYYVRMFQWAAYLPMLRSHGSDTPREIWQFGENSEFYNAIKDAIIARYKMVPYIYSMAAMQHFGDYTMARPLAFDYPGDPAVLDIRDQYMFGDIMVCPVTRPLREVRSRKIYLPKGDCWIPGGFPAGKMEGGQWIERSTSSIGQPIVFYRCGSIMVETDACQNTQQQEGKPLTITVCPGKDASFTIYEDSGDGYGFEQGQFSRIELTWSNKKRALRIGSRQGSYPGMQARRKIICRVMGTDFCAMPAEIEYAGKASTIKFKEATALKTKQ